MGLINIDMIAAAPHVFTMEDEAVGYRSESAIAVDRGKILAVGTIREILSTYKPEVLIQRNNSLLMPGLIDCHCHMELSLLRGLAQDTSNWMMYGLGPFKKHLTDNDLREGFLLGVIEALAAGTTTYGEYGYQMHDIAADIEKIGIRGHLTQLVTEVKDEIYQPGELYAFDDGLGDYNVKRMLDLFDRWESRANGRMHVLFGPQGPDFLSRERLLEIRKLAIERGTKIHMHIAQGDRETAQMIMRYGQRPIKWLDDLGYFDKSLIAVHLTDATDEETHLVAQKGSSMILCSNSIGIIDGLVPPAKVFIDSGGIVGLGSDQAPGNNNHNMFSEMRSTALFNKIKYKDPEIMPAWEVLRMATIDGARAIGLGKSIGSLEAGKCADFIMVNLNNATMLPVYTYPMRNMVPNLVYSARGNEVSLVAVDGKVLYDNGIFNTLDVDSIKVLVNILAKQIGERASQDFIKIHSKNAIFMKEGKL